MTWCAAPPSYPRIFAWVYRHEGRRLKVRSSTIELFPFCCCCYCRRVALAAVSYYSTCSINVLCRCRALAISQQELRCHAVLCTTGRQARQLTARLEQRLREALHDFRREKLCRQSARLSVAACLYDDYASAIPKRKLLLAPGINNYK